MVYSKKLAEDYAENKKKFTSSDHFLWELVQKVGVKNKAILDFGCGDGSECQKFIQLGAKKILGVDNSLSMVKLAQKHTYKNATFIKNSGKKIPAKDKEFDLVYSRFVLHYIKDLGTLFTEIKRVLKPGGSFIAIFQCLTTKPEFENELVPMLLGKGDYKVGIEILSKSIKTIKKDLESAGLIISELKKIKNTDAHFNPAFKNKQKFRNTTYILWASKD